ncbi:MAG: hypothetical protein LRY57_00370 [Alphaproteobacteria bacterium]|nr:hypothetical protein [Alphaproteobacteria bacterium]
MREKLYFFWKHFWVLFLSIAGLLFLFLMFSMALATAISVLMEILGSEDLGLFYAATILYVPAGALIITAPFTLPIYVLSIYIFQRYNLKNRYLQFFTAFIFACPVMILSTQTEKFDPIAIYIILVIAIFGYALPLARSFVLEIAYNSYNK